jgi:hypothetical protein
MRARGRLIAALAAGATLALTVGVGTATAAERPISDARFAAIVKQAWDTGEVTDAQRAEIFTRPDLASTTIDPTSVHADYEEPGYVPDPDEVTTAPKPSASGGRVQAMALAGTSTTSKDRYIVYDNWQNVVLLRYHFVVAWSYNGTSVVGTPSSYTYVKDCYGTCVNYGITSNNQYPNYSNGRLYAWTVPLNAKVTYQKGSDAVSTHTPAVRFGVYYNGTYSYVVLNT